MLADTFDSRTAPARFLARSLACVALLLATRPVAAQSPLYTTQLEKTTASAPLGSRDGDVASFAIPGGQCSGYIDKSLLCGARRAMAVRLTVRDAAFAALRIEDELTGATVTRARCDDDAEVELRVTCDAGSPRDTATRLRRQVARALPPAPE